MPPPTTRPTVKEESWESADSLPTRIATHVLQWRDEKGWSQARLAEEMRAVGVPASRDTIAKLEGRKRQDIRLTELLALALVLQVAPVDLICGELRGLQPKDEVEWLPGTTDFAIDFHGFFGGVSPTKSMFRNADDRQRLLLDFYRHAPDEEKRRGDRRYADDPIAVTLTVLHTFCRDAILGPFDRRNPDPQSLAAAIRDKTDLLATQTGALADYLEALDGWPPDDAAADRAREWKGES